MRAFLARLVNPNDTSVSYGRVAALWALCNVLVWDLANLVFAWKFNVHYRPIGMNPLPLLPDVATMIGQTGFVAAFYGITKYGDLKTAPGSPPGS